MILHANTDELLRGPLMAYFLPKDSDSDRFEFANVQFIEQFTRTTKSVIRTKILEEI